jgi:hypothetical protein
MTSTEKIPYARVNGAWPETLPELTPQEAKTAFKRLYRMTMKKPWKGKIAFTSGNRHNWSRYGSFYLNPKGNHFGGWRDLVHGLSHYCHRKLYPNAKPHSFQHHFLEKEMVEYVVKNGWLEGKLKRKAPEKPAPDPKGVKLALIKRRIENWEKKEQRARNALKKLRRKESYYEAKLHQTSV